MVRVTRHRLEWWGELGDGRWRVAGEWTLHFPASRPPSPSLPAQSQKARLLVVRVPPDYTQ